jgi:O-acetylhomoserine/O-acetylserine sulfhydrylase-like pyridoxal-dependent enzyme
MNYSDINNKKSELTSESLSGNCISSEEMTGTSSNISDLFQREKINFEPCKPSTWPEAKKYDDAFKNNLKRIFYETVINEIDNVIDDSKKINGNLNQRGHV